MITLAYIKLHLLYGLDAAVLSTKQKTDLSDYEKDFLWQLQCLLPNVAHFAGFLIIGTLPVPALLDKRHLSLFGQMPITLFNMSLNGKWQPRVIHPGTPFSSSSTLVKSTTLTSTEPSFTPGLNMCGIKLWPINFGWTNLSQLPYRRILLPG